MQTLIKPTLYRRAGLTYAYGYEPADWQPHEIVVGDKCFWIVEKCVKGGIIPWCSPVGATKIWPPICADD